MNFYCLYNSQTTDSLDVQARLDSLEKACIKNSIKFCLINEATADFSNLPIPSSEDALYNCARGSSLLEMIMINKDVRTFYRNYNLLSQKDDTSQLCIELEKFGIPMPKTIYKGSNNRKLLEQYVDYLNGFPIILKTYGGTGGLGVIIVNDFANLFSLTDYFLSEKKDFQLKEFIPSDSCERVTVLGDEVLYTIRRPIKGKDFRSNGYANECHAIHLSEEINNIAVNATHALNLNYAGVDLIISKKNNKPYILEVNCPQNFVQHEQITGAEYAEKMIEWLFKPTI